MKRILFLALIAMTGLACTALGVTTDPCMLTAFGGQHPKAWKACQTLAAQGDAQAQLNLGFMYHQGQGAPKDYILAYAWLNLAASKTDGMVAKLAVKMRDDLEKGMTSSQIAEAQKDSSALRKSPVH